MFEARLEAQQALNSHKRESPEKDVRGFQVQVSHLPPVQKGQASRHVERDPQSPAQCPALGGPGCWFQACCGLQGTGWMLQVSNSQTLKDAKPHKRQQGLA